MTHAPSHAVHGAASPAPRLGPAAAAARAHDATTTPPLLLHKQHAHEQQPQPQRHGLKGLLARLPHFGRPTAKPVAFAGSISNTHDDDWDADWVIVDPLDETVPESVEGALEYMADTRRVTAKRPAAHVRRAGTRDALPAERRTPGEDDDDAFDDGECEEAFGARGGDEGERIEARGRRYSALRRARGLAGGFAAEWARGDDDGAAMVDQQLYAASAGLVNKRRRVDASEEEELDPHARKRCCR